MDSINVPSFIFTDLYLVPRDSNFVMQTEECKERILNRVVFWSS